MSLAQFAQTKKKLIACRNINAGHGTDTPKMYKEVAKVNRFAHLKRQL